MNVFNLTTPSLQMIAQTIANLSPNGVAVAEAHSGEMNFSGCATGSCMAWA